MDTIATNHPNGTDLRLSPYRFVRRHWRASCGGAVNDCGLTAYQHARMIGLEEVISNALDRVAGRGVLLTG
jgi:hypothetical protein